MNGQVALVTGAAAGIGYGLAQALLKRGVKVCVADMNTSEGERAVQKFKTSYGKENAIFERCDVTSPHDMTKVKSTFGQLNIVCNNAGVYGQDDQIWEQILDVNLKSTIHSTQLAIQHMRKDMGGSGGTILNVASFAGFVPRPECPTYCATKAAVISYTRSMAMSKTLQKNGLKFVALCPSYVDTPLFHRTVSDIEKLPNGQAILEVLNKDVLSLDELIEQAKLLFDDDVKSGDVLVYSKLGGHHFRKFD